MVSGTCALLKWVVGEVEGEQGSGPEGVDDLCFHIYGPQGWDLSLEARI